MKVLSLFDGMACGYEALQRAGIKIDKYYASEIDKYAIQIATKNHPDIIEIGDVTQIKGEDYKDIDLIIGGSPCQGFSIAGKQLNFSDERSKLFFEFVRLVDEIKPKYFLLENVNMKKEYQDIITSYMGVEPIEINSALVSAQNRRRLYRTNIPGIEQPQDKGILLKDILESDVDSKYNLTERGMKMLTNDIVDKGELPAIAYAPGSREYYSNGWKTDKSPTLCARDYKDPKVVMIPIKNATKQGYIEAYPGDGIDVSYPNSETRRGRVQHGKSQTLTTQQSLGVLDENIKIRKLTPIECERLQTLQDNYTEGVSDTQRYKMLGNGWTVDVIAHIFSYIHD